MRPLHLEVVGLTSLRERQVIDFTDLDLFVITGPTGSGKSSLLDAISLALYGRVPRMGGQGNRELVSHGLAQAQVLFGFSAQGVTYQVARTLPRIGAQSAALERLDDKGDWVPDVVAGGVIAVNERLVQVLGLDFEAFKRTVLLPQGDFAAFLSGDPPERRRILTRLLDLGRFQVAAQIAGAEATQLLAEAQAAERQIAAQYDGVDQAALDGAHAARDEAVLVHAEAVEAQQSLSGLAGELAEAAGRATGVVAVDRELAAAERRIAGLADEFAAIEPEETAASAEAERAALALSEALRHREEALSALAETLQSTGDDAALADLDLALQTCTQEDARLRAIEDRRRSGEAELAHVAGALDQASAAAREAERVEAEAADADSAAQERREAARSERAVARDRDAAEREVAAADADLAAKAATRAAAERELSVAAEEAAAAQAHLDHLKGEDEAASFRTRLALGEPCPVCHHVVATIPTATALDYGVAAAQRASRSAAARHQKAVAEATAAIAAQDAAVARLAASHAGLSSLPSASPLAEAERAWRAAEEAATATSLRRSQAADARREAGQAQLAAHVAHAKAAAARGALAAEVAAAEGRRAAASARIAASFPETALEKVAAQVRAWRQQLGEARSAAAKARTACEGAQDVVNRSAAAVAAVARRASSVGDRVMHERGSVDPLLVRGGEFAALPPMPDASSGVGSVLHQLRGVVSDARIRLTDAAEGLKARRDAAEARLRDALAKFGIQPRTLVAADVQAAAAHFVTDAALRLQAAEATASRLSSDLAIKIRLETEASEKRRAATLHQTLANALQANNFIDFILAESVQRLAAVASTELKSISGGRYSLKARDIGFLVVDHANADEERSVSTLSGGETFLASLALATALAQSVTDIAGAAMGGRLEAMFIDEGFGTLDPEALDMVVEALERLRDTDRLVGIITHVAALAERIPDGLAVERTGNSSRVLVRA
ncbi:MAG: SMC family ATPase [Bauldia sp.]|nr:SMC family ATPase [Bauldia sp.]MCW5716886.1 SMC family ATPase [Bauldia sp.]